jgi:hypothetical protein
MLIYPLSILSNPTLGANADKTLWHYIFVHALFQRGIILEVLFFVFIIQTKNLEQDNHV